MKRLFIIAALLVGLLALAAHSQTARIAANGAPRGTAAGVIRVIPDAAAPKTLVIPGEGIHKDDGLQKTYVIPGAGIYGGS